MLLFFRNVYGIPAVSGEIIEESNRAEKGAATGRGDGDRAKESGAEGREGKRGENG